MRYSPTKEHLHSHTSRMKIDRTRNTSQIFVIIENGNVRCLIFLHVYMSQSAPGTHTAYRSQTREQKEFKISEVAADWHELMTLQHVMRPSIACASHLQHAGILLPHDKLSNILERPSHDDVFSFPFLSTLWRSLTEAEYQARAKTWLIQTRLMAHEQSINPANDWRVCVIRVSETNRHGEMPTNFNWPISTS